MLNRKELKWINNYHKKVKKNLLKYISSYEKKDFKEDLPTHDLVRLAISNKIKLENLWK